MQYLFRLRDTNMPSADILVSSGDPAETIVSEQTRLDCDMITISTHGRAGIARSILGSVMDKVLHLTGVPLLGFYFWCNNQFMVQRVLGAKNVDHGRWGVLFAGLLKLPVIFLMVLPGTMARVLYPAAENLRLANNPDLGVE